MAIEIVFLSVVLRKSSLVPLRPEARALVQALFRWKPEWFREDEHFLGTNFMCPADVRVFGGALESRTALRRGADWVVVDMAMGILEPVPWLDFDGGPGKVSGVWLRGTNRGSLSEVPSMVPGQGGAATGSSQAVTMLYGRDSNHDAEEHRADFGRIIPAWGGKDLWLVEVGPELDDDGTERPKRWISIEAGATDFRTLEPGPGPEVLPPGRPMHLRGEAPGFANPTIQWLFFDQLKVDACWSLRTPGGFTWWADRQAQTIEVAGEEADPDGGLSYLVSVQTELLHDLELDDRTLPMMHALLMPAAAMAGPVYDVKQRTLKLCSLVRVHEDIASWMNPLISVAAITQIAEAKALGPRLAQVLGAQAAVSGHPVHGIRPAPDELAEVVALVIQPQGRAPSRWIPDEFQETVDQYMAKPPSLGGTSGGPGLTVEFPYGDASSLCRMRSDDPHPAYGHGLLLVQSFPADCPSEADGIRLALALNATELTDQPFGYGFGSYVYRDGMIHFTGFLPNAVYRRGLLPSLYYACANRARAMSVRLMNQDWTPASFDLARSALGRAMSRIKGSGPKTT
jgi:hypothetical protein